MLNVKKGKNQKTLSEREQTLVNYLKFMKLAQRYCLDCYIAWSQKS